jgi:hypothetical protein
VWEKPLRRPPDCQSAVITFQKDFLLARSSSAELVAVYFVLTTYLLLYNSPSSIGFIFREAVSPFQIKARARNAGAERSSAAWRLIQSETRVPAVRRKAEPRSRPNVPKDRDLLPIDAHGSLELESTQMDWALIAATVFFGLTVKALWADYRGSRRAKRESREVGYRRGEIQIDLHAVSEFKPTWRDMRDEREER